MLFYIVIIAIIVLLIIFLHLQNNTIDITTHTVENENVKDNIRIVQLSDLHSKPFMKVLKKVEELKPDIIAITGDYINDHGRNKDKMLSFGKLLLEIAPVYYITGNHERRLDYFEALMQEISDMGFVVLNNKLGSAKVGDSTISILGLDENQADFDDYKARKNGTFVYQDMSPYFRELEATDGFRLVLSHFPENFEAVAENHYCKYDFDVQLSGHAHGGQFILPLIGPVLSPSQGLFPKYARGSFGSRPMLIVSRGLGNAEFPFRLFNHPEIIVLDIKAKKRG